MEGWVVGATLPPGFLTSAPLNEVERQDTDGAWRREQYDKLSGSYADFWDSIDHFIHITGPGFSAVKKWRLEQEATNLNVDLKALPNERQEWVSSFIQHFERLTRSMHDDYKRSGITLRIDDVRQYIGGYSF